MTISLHINKISSFHAHIYYDAASKVTASQLRKCFVKHYDCCFDDEITIGQMHDAPIGPHTCPMFAVEFDGFVLHYVLDFLILNRQGLTVLIHPETGNDLEDHTTHAIWLGKPIELDLSKL